MKLEQAFWAEEYTVDRCLRYLDSAIPVARAGSDEGLTAVRKVVAAAPTGCLTRMWCTFVRWVQLTGGCDDYRHVTRRLQDTAQLFNSLTSFRQLYVTYGSCYIRSVHMTDLFVCLSIVCPFAHLSVCPPPCLSVNPSVCLSVLLSVCLSVSRLVFFCCELDWTGSVSCQNMSFGTNSLLLIS